MKTNGELTDGERLKRKFAELKIAKGIGKAEFARITTFPGGASMISQNVSNHKPISLAGAKAYSLGFGCAIEDISPSIAASLPNEGTGKKSRGLLDQQVSDTTPIEVVSGSEFPSYPLAQAQMDKAIALSGQAASLGPKAAMAGLSELVAALHPVLLNAGRDALRQWVDGAIDAEQAAATLEALTHTSENMKANDGSLRATNKGAAFTQAGKNAARVAPQYQEELNQMTQAAEARRDEQQNKQQRTPIPRDGTTGH